MKNVDEKVEEVTTLFPKKLYITCPVCSKQLIQVESIVGGVMRCHGCRRYISLNANNGKVITEVIK